VAAAYALLEVAEAPFVWIALLAVTLCIATFRRARSTALKMVCVNVAAAVAFLGAYEGYLTLTQERPLRYDDSRGYRRGSYFIDDPVLGYGAKPSARVSVSHLLGDEAIYDVTLTIDEHGLRVSPPVAPGAVPLGCVWFFGGSYTFGEGVEDDQAMPYRVGVRSGGRYVVRNFGFHGYGPHQMLAELQSGRTEARAGCVPTHVIYQGMVWHAQRAAGRAFWDLSGPRYVLDADGRALRAGTFRDQHFDRPPEWIRTRLERSQIYKKHLAKYVDPLQRPLGLDDVRLMSAIITASANEVARRFPGAEFHVLLWDVGGPPYADRIVDMLAARGIRVHRVSDAIPDFDSPSAPSYRLHQRDTHPSAAAHDRIAAYVVGQILGVDDE
jgi:hypothetical protein